jgi:hypothetical protein
MWRDHATVAPEAPCRIRGLCQPQPHSDHAQFPPVTYTSGIVHWMCSRMGIVEDDAVPFEPFPGLVYFELLQFVRHETREIVLIPGTDEMQGR